MEQRTIKLRGLVQVASAAALSPTRDIPLAAVGVHAVRIQLNGTHPLSLAEVQVWGAPSP